MRVPNPPARITTGMSGGERSDTSSPVVVGARDHNVDPRSADRGGPGSPGAYSPLGPGGSVPERLSRVADVARTAIRRRLSDGARSRLRHHLRWPRARWGNLDRTDPFSIYGFDRGVPVDRVYIEAFLSRHADTVRGDVLEVKDDAYARRFGGERVLAHVLELPGVDNGRATLFADLGEPGSLPTDAFDCVVLTQTLQLVDDTSAALTNVWRSLRPGATALITVPTVSVWVERIHDRWRWTPAGLDVELRRALPGADIEVVGYGNLPATIAFLHGLGAREVPADLHLTDPRFPVIAAARITRPEHADG